MTSAGPQEPWRLVGVAFAVLMVTLGAATFSLGVLVKPIADEFAVGRAQVALAFTLFALTTAVLAPWLGHASQRLGLRNLMLLGCLSGALGYSGLATASSLTMVQLSFGILIATGVALAGAIPCCTVLVSRFPGHRGLAVGLAMVGVSAGGPLFLNLAAWLIETSGWRSVGWLGVAINAVVLPPLVLMLTGATTNGGEGLVSASASRDPFRFRDSRFWRIVAVLGLGSLPAVAVIQTLHSHLTDGGMTAGTAALLLSLVALVAALAKPVSGRLSDRLGIRPVAGAALALQAAGVCVLAATSGQGAWAAAILFGLGFGANAPMDSLILARAYGPQHFTRAMGIVTAALLPFSMAALPLASWGHDVTGSYRVAYVSLAGSLVLALATLYSLKFLEGEPDSVPGVLRNT